jgi:Gas vesicle synthesis protein GvpL/GvpF
VATYLYGLILAGNAQRVPAAVGIGGTEVRVIRCGVLAAIVSTVDEIPPRPSFDDVRTHDAVLQAAVDRGCTTAAVRFRQTFDDDDEACRHVREHGERLVRLLEDYDGCVEMRVLLPESHEVATRPTPPSSEQGIGPGRAYLEALRAEATSRSTDLALAAALGATIRAERVEELPKSRGVVFAHLVDRAALPAYREAIAALPSLSEAKLVGPLPLYSFAEPAA